MTDLLFDLPPISDQQLTTHQLATPVILTKEGTHKGTNGNEMLPAVSMTNNFKVIFFTYSTKGQ